MRNTVLRVLKNKWALAAVTATVVFGSAFAFAATLGINTSVLQAGNGSVTTCAASNIDATYTTAYSQSAHAYTVNDVKLADVSGCGSKKVTVEFTGASNAALGEASATLAASPGTSPVSIGAPSSTVDASAVTGLSIAIAG
jgi:hypothetical protein